MNRLQSAETATTWGSGYVYDAWGNLLQKNSIHNKPPGEYVQQQVDRFNRLLGHNYDASGNMTTDGNTTYAYDAANQLTGPVGGPTYVYDALGQRIRKDSGSAATEYVYFGGQTITEQDSQAGLTASMLTQSGLTAFIAAYIVDGNTGSAGWHTDSAVAGAWLKVDLGSATAITSARIFAATPGYAGAYNIQYSDDNAAWSNAGSITPGSQGWNEVRWSSVGAHRYWRLYLTNSPGPGSWLMELQLGMWTDYVYFGGQRVASRKADGNTYYYLSDHLGTARLLTNGQGAVCYDADFYPFGGERVVIDTCSQHYKFTGKERDTESGLDMFGARYYGSSLGRFMTPDWAAQATAVPYAVFGDPQTLNLYGYVRNSPLTKVDADGHCPWCIVGGIVVAGGIIYELKSFHDKEKADYNAAWNRTWDALNNNSGTNDDLLAGQNAGMKMDADTGVLAIKMMGPSQGNESPAGLVVDVVADKAKSTMIDAMANSSQKTLTHQGQPDRQPQQQQQSEPPQQQQQQTQQTPSLWQRLSNLFSPPPPPPSPPPKPPTIRPEILN